MEESPEETRQTSSLRRNWPLIVVISAIFGGLILLCMFAYLLLGPAGEQDSAEDTTVTPTPFAADDFGLDSDFISVNLPDSDEPVQVQTDSPVFLGIGNREYGIQVDVITPDGRWNPSLADENTASWVFGTVLNYVYGVADTETNRALMESLQPGDELRIAMKDGSVLTYAFNSREITSRTDQDVFLQSAPGITIVLMGTDGDDRMVIRGAYVASETEPDGIDVGNSSAELGEPASLGDLQITVLGATQLYDQPQAPAGFNFFVVDFQIQNNGSNPFTTNQLVLVLRDDLGNLYAASPIATQLGTYPTLVGVVPPGETVLASVGYAIPAGLNVSSVNWVVTDRATAGEVTILIPFAGGDEAAASTRISMTGAEVSDDGTRLIIQGDIFNEGSEAVIVSESSVKLQGIDGTNYLLLSTNPAFPWVVNPGATLVYFVSFQRPGESDAIFTVLNQSYSLSGIR
ncbi:MAG: DUF4352 domain-containing protein [Anaerolineae bacterium]|nr:DUF4352 domain-containing protein [Anaerolineae bacterium]